MVIECPSCRTKFAIDSQQLAEVEKPRFHCSRCDHFFELSEEEQELDDGQEPQENLEDDSEDSEEFSPWDPKQLSLIPEPEPDYRAFSITKVSASYSRGLEDDWELESLPPIAVDWPELSGKSDYEADLRSQIAAGLPSQTTKKTHPTHHDTSSTPRAVFDDIQSDELPLVTEELAEDILDSRPFVPKFTEALDDLDPVDQFEESGELPSGADFELAPSWLEPEDEEASGVWRLTSSSQSMAKVVQLPEAGNPQKEKKNVKLRKKANRHLARSLRETAAALAEVGLSSRRRLNQSLLQLIVLLSLPLLLTTGFSHWSKNIDSTPPQIKSVFLLDHSELPQVPPPGLEIVEVDSQVITLDDGKRVLEIKGKLLNATKNGYRDAILEAKLYDSNNREIKKLLVNLNNSLRNAKLQALKEEAITSLQSKKRAGLSEIRPNAKLGFRVVFTDLDGSEAWQSTRVYSVRS